MIVDFFFSLERERKEPQWIATLKISLLTSIYSLPEVLLSSRLSASIVSVMSPSASRQLAIPKLVDVYQSLVT